MKTQKGNSSFLGAHGGPFMLNKFKLDFILHEHCKGATIMSANLINMQCQVLYSFFFFKGSTSTILFSVVGSF